MSEWKPLFDRRAFLKSLIATGTITITGYPSAANGAPTNRSQAQNELLAYVSARHAPISALRNASAATAQAFDLSVNKHAHSGQIIQVATDPSVALDPKSFDAMYNLTQAAQSSPAFDHDAVAKYLTMGIQTAAAAGSAFFPVAFLPLALESIWIQPAIKYVIDAANPEYDTSPIPDASLTQQQLAAQAAFFMAAGVAESNQTFSKALELSAVKAKTGLDCNATDSQLTSDLPDNWKPVAQAAFGATPADLNDPKFIATVQQAIQDQLQAGYKDLSQQVDTIKQTMQKQQSAADRQTQREAITQTDQEMAGTVTIAGFVADHIFHDKGAAQKLVGGGNAIRNIYTSIAKFAIGDIGVLALSGGLLGAADTIMGLFGGGPDPIMLELQKISDQLQDIQKELTVIEQKEDQILQALQALYASLYDSIKTGDQKADANFEFLKQLLVIEFDQVEQGERDKASGDLISNVTKVNTLLKDNQHDHTWQTECTNALSNIHDYAVYTSAHTYYTGTPGTSDTVAQLLNNGHGSRADLLFGVIPSVCTDAGITFNSQFTAPLGSTTKAVPNPIAWAYATRIYLQISAVTFNVTQQIDPDQLNNMWTQGLRIREAAQIFSSPGTIVALTQLYGKYAGIERTGTDNILASLKQYAGEFCKSNNLMESYAFTTLDGSNPHAQLPWSPNLYLGNSEVYDLTNDPLQAIIDRKLLSVDVKTYQPKGIFTWERFTLDNQKYTRQSVATPEGKIQFRFLISGWDLSSVPTVRPDLLKVMDTANKMLRLTADWPIISQGLAEKMVDGMVRDQNSVLFQSFLWTASVVRWAAVIATWRRSGDSIDSETAARLENVGMPVSLDEYKNVVRSIVVDPPKAEEVTPDFNWPTFICNRFLSVLQNSVRLCSQSAAGLTLEQGIPEVDETLKMLAGYMHVRGLHAPIPAPIVHPRRPVAAPIHIQLQQRIPKLH